MTFDASIFEFNITNLYRIFSMLIFKSTISLLSELNSLNLSSAAIFVKYSCMD